ncbi:hypothetical protein ACQUSR_02555 [Streptomyces sp. P1-3]
MGLTCGAPSGHVVATNQMTAASKLGVQAFDQLLSSGQIAVAVP